MLNFEARRSLLLPTQLAVSPYQKLKPTPWIGCYSSPTQHSLLTPACRQKWKYSTVGVCSCVRECKVWPKKLPPIADPKPPLPALKIKVKVRAFNGVYIILDISINVLYMALYHVGVLLGKEARIWGWRELFHLFMTSAIHHTHLWEPISWGRSICILIIQVLIQHWFSASSL